MNKPNEHSVYRHKPAAHVEANPSRPPPDR